MHNYIVQLLRCCQSKRWVAFLELCTTYQHSQSTCGNCNITVIVISPTFAAKESCYTQNN